MLYRMYSYYDVDGHNGFDIVYLFEILRIRVESCRIVWCRRRRSYEGLLRFWQFVYTSEEFGNIAHLLRRTCLLLLHIYDKC